MIVAVFVERARTGSEANDLCKKTRAYRVICSTYPSRTWNRKHVSTKRHNPTQAIIPDGEPSSWDVMFEVEKKESQT